MTIKVELEVEKKFFQYSFFLSAIYIQCCLIHCSAVQTVYLGRVCYCLAVCKRAVTSLYFSNYRSSPPAHFKKQKKHWEIFRVENFEISCFTNPRWIGCQSTIGDVNKVWCSVVCKGVVNCSVLRICSGQSSALQCILVQYICYAVQWSIVQCSSVHYSAVQCPRGVRVRILHDLGDPDCLHCTV